MFIGWKVIFLLYTPIISLFITLIILPIQQYSYFLLSRFILFIASFLIGTLHIINPDSVTYYWFAVFIFWAAFYSIRSLIVLEKLKK